jgi:uncharacterized membrane protein YedE/YeeE
MDLNNTHYAALGGFLIALAFGAVANKTRFCNMGAVTDWVLMGDKNRLRAWLLAIAVATIGTQILQAAGLIDLRQSIYLTANFSWLGHLFGGLIFGIGMTLTGGCGQRSLVRLGGGSVKSLIVILVLAISAAMTLYGLLAFLRTGYIEATNIDLATHNMPDQAISSAILAATGLANAQFIHIGAVAGIALGLLIFVFNDAEFRRSFDNIFAGVSIGLFVTAGWFVTGWLAKDDFDPIRLESFSFVAPVGNALQYVMTFTGSKINFGIAAVFGVIVGSFLYAVSTGRFRIETFSTRTDMLNHLAGAMLMGFGGVLALGCTVGQGITGMSTLALGSMITLASIMFGSAMTVKIQYHLLGNQGFFHALRLTLADFRLLPVKKAV